MVLSIAQVCELMGCKRATVFVLLKTGILERAPRYGRELRIYRDSVEAALARPTRRTRAKRTRAGKGVDRSLRDEMVGV